MRIEKNRSASVGPNQFLVSVLIFQTRFALFLLAALVAMAGAGAAAQTQIRLSRTGYRRCLTRPTKTLASKAGRCSSGHGIGPGWLYIRRFQFEAGEGALEVYLAAADKIGATNFKVALSADMSQTFPRPISSR